MNLRDKIFHRLDEMILNANQDYRRQKADEIKFLINEWITQTAGIIEETGPYDTNLGGFGRW